MDHSQAPCLNEIAREIMKCCSCPLCKSRTRPVLGEGKGDVMIVGEAPGKEEDLLGRPFVGRAGKLLRSILKEIGLIDNVYITNAVKCRPPNNRTPTEIERRTCKRFLVKEIECVDPQVIVALGRVATKSILEADLKIRDYHGKVLERNIIGKVRKVIITYHPAAALRKKELVNLLIEDFKIVKRVIELA